MLGRRLCLAALLIPALLFAAAAVSPAARLGDPAAELAVAEWIKGGPVKLADGKGKTIFVVEFWASWCPSSVDSIPYLTKLQRAYKDKGVVFVGITAEEPAEVKSFVQEMGSKMGYAVAVDARGVTTRAYRAAFGIQWIPYAFIVDKEGKIAWHGFPTGGLEEVLDAILAGEYDIRTARLYETTFHMIVRYYELACEPPSPDGKKALTVLGGRVITLALKTENALFLNNFAWLIMKDEDIQERDLELALKAAKAAYDLCEGKILPVIDTYAWALFENGRAAEAIEMEKSGLPLCEDEEDRARVAGSLESFEGKAAESN